jgi:hypothetical protein
MSNLPVQLDKGEKRCLECGRPFETSGTVCSECGRRLWQAVSEGRLVGPIHPDFLKAHEINLPVDGNALDDRWQGNSDLMYGTPKNA